ncbi:MAG: hypothetical protein J5844_04215 [Clostridia bacterium]|nr:hypothetical protein [Clostridia bacterium]
MKLLIDTVIKNEAARNEQMIKEYETLISNLPKGTLICRKNGYYYLKYRENGKVCDKYVGKDVETVAQLQDKLEVRRHYSEMLAALKREQKAIYRMMEDF